MGIILFPGLPEYSPTFAECSSSDLTQKLEATTGSEEDLVKALIEKKLEEVAQLRMKLRGIEGVEEVNTTPKPKAEESVALLRTGMVSTQTEEPPQSSADSQVDSNWQAPQAAVKRPNLKNPNNPRLQKQIESSSSDESNSESVQPVEKLSEEQAFINRNKSKRKHKKKKTTEKTKGSRFGRPIRPPIQFQSV